MAMIRSTASWLGSPCGGLVATLVLSGALGACHLDDGSADDAPPPPVAAGALEPAPVIAPPPTEPVLADTVSVEQTTAPDEGTGVPEVRGSLPREVIRRVVQRHQGEVRACYEQGLARRPALEGRVTVSFVISANGSVQSAAIGSSTLDDEAVAGCIVQAVRGWVFPAPDGGGVVGVSYPFVLRPAEPGASQAAPPPPLTDADRARARQCTMDADHACVIRLLDGRAETESDLAMLIEAYRASGQSDRALRYMRIYIEKFPSRPRARGYQMIVARSDR